MKPLRIYVSYSQEDRRLAEQAVKVLSQMGLHPVWDKDPRAGTRFSAVSKGLISDAQIFMPIITRNSIRRPWVHQEIGYAMAMNVPVLIIALDTLPREMTEQLHAIEVKEDLSDLAERLRNIEPVFFAPSAAIDPISIGEVASVFISAKSADHRFAIQIFQFLRSKGVTAFLSQESLPELGNSDYRKEIDRALDSAAHMVVVTSSLTNVMSTWVEAEWGFFINEKRSGRKPGNLITVVVGDLKPSDLPPSLRYYEVMSFQPGEFERVLQYVSS